MIVILQAEKQKEKSILNPKENDREENRRQKIFQYQQNHFSKLFTLSHRYIILCYAKNSLGKESLMICRKLNQLF